MDKNMQDYYNYTISPLGTVFYNTAWKQLEHIEGKTILDFGSGFAFTSNFLAKKNTVTALEQDASMIEAAQQSSSFTQIHGNLDYVKNLPAESFDVVICHLIFEFVDNAQEILQELIRVLKKDGTLSLIRHNRAGRLIQAIVQEENIEEGHKLLEGGYAYSGAFGDIKYYENEDVLYWAEQRLSIKSVQGIRALASLHSAQMQNQEQWAEKMLALEWELLKKPHFVNIAYFNHLLLRKC